MSLLFERAIRAFSGADARYLEATPDSLEPAAAADRSIDLGYLAELVSNRHDALAHPDRDEWSCVPLHEPDAAELSGEYVVFERHPVRGDIFAYRNAETGEDEPLAPDDVGDTALARRLRFWLPEHEPDERPSFARDGPWTGVPPANPVPADERDGYFDRLERFVTEERDAERERNRERARHHTPGELFGRGESAIPELVGFDLPSDGTLHCQVNEGGDVDVEREFGVFEGNEVFVHGPSDDDAPVEFPLPATVRRIADRMLDLELESEVPDGDALRDFLNRSDGVGLSLRLNPTTYDRESAAVRTVRDDPDRRAVLVGARDASYAGRTAAETAQHDPELDGTQAFAATAGLYAEDVCCVHGPPGTGKTRTLVEIVRRTVANGGRALVCADSNQGVDNVLVGESTADDLDRSSLHYFATEADEFTLDRHREYHSDSELVREEYDDDPHRPDVVATTNSSAADFPDGAFDVAVVDEATQATTTSALIPLTKADRVVLAGDHKQLPPYNATDAPPEDDRYRSLFEHFYTDDGVYGPSCGVRLTTQYRMHEEIAAFPNRAFYDGTVRTGVDVEPVDDLPPLVGVDVDGREREDETGSYANPEEASVVRGLVEELLDAGVAGHDVGVIAPYQAQVDEVESTLADLSHDEGDDVIVDTVDSFQGGEREAVVVTFTRSNDGGDIGFLGRTPDGPRRLNVALTRGERFCGLVADWETLRDDGGGRNECADLYRDLYEQLERTDRIRTAE